MSNRKLTIAFDADDTLWDNETHYLQAGVRLKHLLSGYQDPERVEQDLGETDVRNVHRYGYGIKSYTLSMVEVAIRVTDGQIAGRDIQKILELGQGMLSGDVLLFEHAEETLAHLAGGHNLMLVTKGDLVEQGNKLDRSGLAGYFCHVEIVREKTAAIYRLLLDRHGISPEQFIMVGNSLKSDILPVVEIGGRAVYIPYQHTWAYERTAGDRKPGQAYYELEHLGQLPGLVDALDRP